MAEGTKMQNQLRFNLGVPITATNLAVRYHRPNPIVVERAGGLMPVPHPHPQSTQAQVRRPDQNNTSLQFTSLSEDRLELAVRLAQRDLKKRRDNHGSSVLPQSRSPSPKAGRTKIIHSKESKERSARLQQKSRRGPVRVRERDGNVPSRSKNTRTQTPPRQSDKTHLPATTNSPPTRDTDRYPPQSGKGDNPSQEVDRLQKEMESYLQQIQVIEQQAMQEPTRGYLQPCKSRRREGYLSDEEDAGRKVIRQEEQAIRAARQIYFLRQQVRSLQEDVTRIGPDKARHTKKSKVMMRLAAAHRGAVRAIQSFVTQQLPQQDLQHGLPASYHELSLLIRQLAIVSTQIGRDKDDESNHVDLLRMLDRVDELNRVWCAERGEASQPEAAADRRRKSPSRPTQVESEHGRQPRPQKITGKENRPKGLLKKTYKRGSKPVTKPSRQEVRAKTTPERQATLRAGLAALMQSDDRQGGTGVAWNIPPDSSTTESMHKSLILPKGLQTKREKAKKSVALAVPESHFSDPTISSNLKVVDQNASVTAPDSPGREPWRPGGSQGMSPARHGRSRSRSPGRTERNVHIQDLDTELIRELFPRGTDGQGSRDRSPWQRSRSPPQLQRRRSGSPPRGGSLRVQRGALTAKDILLAQERRQELAGINVRQMIADRAIDKAEVNGEVLSEMILHDLLRDMAEELDDMETEQEQTREAHTVQHNPTLENLYQRLEQMELEQLDIRRRWGTFHFEEEEGFSRNTQHFDKPSGPVAVEITRRGMAKSHKSHSTRPFQKDADEPIIFTKSAPAVRFHEKSTPLVTEEDEDMLPTNSLRGPQRIRLELPQHVVDEVHSNLEKYERHLKRIAHESQGRFDPWRLVEEISDQVLEECLREIDGELEEMEEAIVHQVCKTEFTIPDPPAQDEEGPTTNIEIEDEPIEEVSPIASEDDYETVSDSEEDEEP